MKNAMVEKYGFRIRTRNGAIVENLSIAGRDALDAQRKLLQMYRGCEILASFCLTPANASRKSQSSYEDVVDLITAR